jgi:hypothetical protein
MQFPKISVNWKVPTGLSLRHIYNLIRLINVLGVL